MLQLYPRPNQLGLGTRVERWNHLVRAVSTMLDTEYVHEDVLLKRVCVGMGW